ncbi:hypothetical protein L2E82_19740 [Cichorium intybus]|uniref:Uncharacterized protein n=1 Tax=Cichorium intybus TaxID=13427 RepID=A0ACB9FDN5_CICIN|nr:hypothetical protein L2E82_19740 [Cichorium intybus]
MVLHGTIFLTIADVITIFRLLHNELNVLLHHLIATAINRRDPLLLSSITISKLSWFFAFVATPEKPSMTSQIVLHPIKEIPGIVNLLDYKYMCNHILLQNVLFEVLL